MANYPLEYLLKVKIKEVCIQLGLFSPIWGRGGWVDGWEGEEFGGFLSTKMKSSDTFMITKRKFFEKHI